jgi:hypothetical protein
MPQFDRNFDKKYLARDFSMDVQVIARVMTDARRGAAEFRVNRGLRIVPRN